MARNHPTYVSFGNDVLLPLQICTSEDCNWTPVLGVFGGAMAKASGRDVLSPALYRIKPGTHAHVINYIVIDESSDLIEKVKSGDPEL